MKRMGVAVTGAIPRESYGVLQGIPDLSGCSIPIHLCFYPLASTTAELSAQPSVLEETNQFVGKCFRVVGIDQEAGLTIPHGLDCATTATSDDWQPASACFQIRYTKSLNTGLLLFLS